MIRWGNLCTLVFSTHTCERALQLREISQKYADEDRRRRFERYSFQCACLSSETVEACRRPSVWGTYFVEQGKLKLNYLSYSQPSLYFFGFRIRPLYLLETLVICILVILELLYDVYTAITTIRSFSCRMELVSSFTIRPLLHAKSFRSISNTTILRALFVSWICVSNVLKITDRYYRCSTFSWNALSYTFKHIIFCSKGWFSVLNFGLLRNLN